MISARSQLTQVILAGVSCFSHLPLDVRQSWISLENRFALGTILDDVSPIIRGFSPGLQSYGSQNYEVERTERCLWLNMKPWPTFLLEGSCSPLLGHLPPSISLKNECFWTLFQGGPIHPWCSGTWEDSAGVRDACGGEPHAHTLGHAGQNV